jgi:hypothetical protein
MNTVIDFPKERLPLDEYLAATERVQAALEARHNCPVLKIKDNGRYYWQPVKLIESVHLARMMTFARERYQQALERVALDDNELTREQASFWLERYEVLSDEYLRRKCT